VGSEFPSKACQSNYPILPSAKISPNGFITAFTALMTFKESHVPRTVLMTFKENHVPTTGLMTFKESHVPTTVLVTFKESHVPTTALMTFKENHVPTTALMTFKESHVPTTALKMFKESHVPTTALMTFKESHVPTTALMMFKESHVPTTVSDRYQCINQGSRSFPDSKIHLSTLGASRARQSKFHAEHPRKLCATVQNPVVTTTWRLGFVHPSLKIFNFQRD
jgi:hypothetical protein